ncbi:MAG: class I adenylate-forming enzyme family protein [Myxococcota bacterium]
MIEQTLEALERNRGRVLLVGCDAGGEIGWERSGADLLTEVGAWQAELHRRGVRPGDRVGLDLPRSPQLLPAHLATLAGGATVVPVNPALSERERERVLERAELRTLVTADSTARAASSVRIARRPERTPALLIFTSGTTGEPKGVPLSLENLEANLAALSDAWRLAPEDRLLHVLPCHHLHGLVLGLYGSLRIGMSLVLAERFEASATLAALERRQASVFMAVPTLLRRLALAPEARPVPSLRLYISGSAPFPAKDFALVEARLGAPPLERYGLSETMIVTTNPHDGERRPGTVGKPLPDTELRLAPDGEIEVRGPAVMEGYWRAPELDRVAFRDGFFRTGDLGCYDEAGYLRIVGRKKELILVGGTNVVPGAVEEALGAGEGVVDLAVAGLPDADLGERVAAFVVAAPDVAPSDLEARLRERAARALAPYERPRLYFFVDALPRNAMGKLDRRALRASWPGG